MLTATADWTAAKIRARLVERELTLSGISVRRGLHKDACSKALRQRWAAAEQAIAEALNVAPAEIWPSRYSAERSSETCRENQPAPSARTVEADAERSEPSR